MPPIFSKSLMEFIVWIVDSRTEHLDGRERESDTIRGDGKGNDISRSYNRVAMIKSHKARQSYVLDSPKCLKILGCVTQSINSRNRRFALIIAWNYCWCESMQLANGMSALGYVLNSRYSLVCNRLMSRCVLRTVNSCHDRSWSFMVNIQWWDLENLVSSKGREQVIWYSLSTLDVNPFVSSMITARTHLQILRFYLDTEFPFVLSSLA